MQSGYEEQSELTRTRLVVVRWAALLLTLWTGVLLMKQMHIQQIRSNELKKEEIDIKKQQPDLARRQFALDSIVFEQNIKNR